MRLRVLLLALFFPVAAFADGPPDLSLMRSQARVEETRQVAAVPQTTEEQEETAIFTTPAQAPPAIPAYLFCGCTESSGFPWRIFLIGMLCGALLFWGLFLLWRVFRGPKEEKAT